MFYQYFINKTNNKELTDNSEFLKADLGTVFKKADGEEYVKVDTIVFDKVSRSIRSDQENDNRFARLNYANTFTQSNTFNDTTKVIQATFDQKSCIDNNVAVKHTNLTIPDITNTHKFVGNEAEANNVKINKSLTATCRPVFDNMTVNGNTKTNTLNVTQDSVLNKVSATNVTCTSVSASSSVTVPTLSVTRAGNIKDLSVSNNANVGNTLTVMNINSSGNASLSTVTTNKLTSNNILPSVTSGANIGSITYKYSNVYAENFQGTALNAKYADLAEKYTTDANYPEGTVLQINTVGTSELTMFNGGALGGVISTKPAVKMNYNTKGQFVALKGRVPVRCKGVVQKGQYCVAQRGGVVKGFSKADLTPEIMLDVVGVALSDSTSDEMVEVKI